MKNSVDAATKFDVSVEVWKGTTLKVASAQINAVTFGTASAVYNATKAALKQISLSAIAAPGVSIVSGDTLNLKVFVKVNSTSAHASANATLWFNISGASGDTSSHLHATIDGVNDKYFLVGNAASPASFVLKKSDPGSGLTPQAADVAADKIAFKLFGTWAWIVP